MRVELREREFKKMRRNRFDGERGASLPLEEARGSALERSSFSEGEIRERERERERESKTEVRRGAKSEV